MARLHPTPPSSAVSFWEDDFGDYTPNQPLETDLDLDVAIIGGGYTGLTAAREFANDAPGSDIAVLEGQYVGFGASGRNGGFSMSLFGLEPEVTVLRWGRERAQAAHDYMVQAIDYVRQVVGDNNIQCDYEHTGMLRVAYAPSQKKRLGKTLELLNSFDKTGQRYQYIEKAELAGRVNTDKFQCAIYEPDTGILNPAKHVRSLKTLAEKSGAKVFENTPVISIDRGGNKIILRTAKGTVRCEKLVIAVNAWSDQINGLKRIRSRQAPVWTAQVVTEPLSDEIWTNIGWAGREAIEDNRQLVHYFRRTRCVRISIGGGSAEQPADKLMAQMDCKELWSVLETRLRWMFPILENVRVDYRWGGPVSVNLDMTPEIGHIGDERVIYACGCIGHGVSLTQLNGRLIADLLSERKSELTDFWIVNRKAIPWPPDPIGYIGSKTINFGLRMWDRIEERNLEI